MVVMFSCVDEIHISCCEIECIFCINFTVAECSYKCLKVPFRNYIFQYCKILSANVLSWVVA
jgi:hypothetical protein